MGVEKNEASVTSECTYAHSMTPFSPFKALINEMAKRAPAIAMDKVAEPAPALALTTSVPASWIRSVKAFSWSAGNETVGWHCEMSGKIYNLKNIYIFV